MSSKQLSVTKPTDSLSLDNYQSSVNTDMDPFNQRRDLSPFAYGLGVMIFLATIWFLPKLLLILRVVIYHILQILIIVTIAVGIVLEYRSTRKSRF